MARLPVGAVVWCRFCSYPFWPAIVEDNALVGDERQISVRFFGDGTLCVCAARPAGHARSDTVTRPEVRLRPFVCAEFATFLAAGKSASTTRAAFIEAVYEVR